MLDDHPELFGTLTKLGEHLTCVNISDVLRFFYEENDKEVWDWRDDFPSYASPFTLAWYESSAPKCSNSNGKVIELSSDFKRLGWSVISFHIKPEERESAPPLNPLWTLMQAISGVKPLNDMTPRFDGYLPHFMQGTTVFYELASGRVYPGGGLLDYLDKDGKPILTTRLTLMPKELLQFGTDAVGGSTLSLAFAISLLHCKNVSLEDIPIPPKLQKRRLIRGKAPKVQYKTLRIEPMKKVLRGEGGSAETGLCRAMHICRGHFRTYTETAKLFGRVSGTVWVPQHVRGTRDAGVVVKNYKVAAPAHSG